MKRSVISLALLLAFASAPAAAQQTKISLLVSWDRNDYASYEGAEAFSEQVQRIGGGKVQIEIKGPETVPPFQQIQPVSAGVFDMLFSHGVYHAGSKGLALAADAITPDPQKRRDGGVYDYVDAYYQKHNKLKLIAMTVLGTHGYNIVLRRPVSPEGDLNGRKIRGTQTYFGVIKTLGGTPVVLPTSEVYTGLEKGVIDGATRPAAGAYTQKLYEVAKYRMRPTFGSATQPFWINMVAWQKLPEEARRIVTEAGLATERVMMQRGDATFAREETELEKVGSLVTTLPAAKAEAIERAFYSSVWELAEQCCADGAKPLREIALKAGLTY